MNVLLIQRTNNPLVTSGPKSIIMKICLSLLLILLTLFSKNVLAFQEGAYVGASLNYEYFYGKRTDGDTHLIENTTAFLSKNQHFHNSKAGFDLFFGFLDCIYDSNWIWGIEPYFGYKFNSTKITGQIPTNGSPEIDVVDFRRKWDFGINFRLGRSICTDYFVYALIGPEFGYFSFNHNADNDVVKKNKWIPGVCVGGGIEKQFSCFNLGLQLTYSAYNTSTLSQVDSVPSNVFITVKPRVVTLAMRLSIPVQ